MKKLIGIALLMMSASAFAGGNKCWSPLKKSWVNHGEMGKKKCCYYGDWTSDKSKCEKKERWVCEVQNSYTFTKYKGRGSDYGTAYTNALNACKAGNSYKGNCLQKTPCTKY